MLKVLLATYVFAPQDRWVRGIGIFAFLVALIMATRGNLSAVVSAVVGGIGWILIYLAAARWFWRANGVSPTPRA